MGNRAGADLARILIVPLIAPMAQEETMPNFYNEMYSTVDTVRPHYDAFAQ